MRLESAYIKNFKLLEDVDLQFSSDLRRPLTVIRAENGSGKTSILYALRWGMYGEKGIPPQMRLTSTAKPPEQPVPVQVRLEFTTTDPYSDVETRYRLIRTCEEVPLKGDRYERGIERRRLLRWTERGEEEIEGDAIEGLISEMLPISLANVFFTNGDDVQRFISSGQQAEQERQEAVHMAIRQLLGLDHVELAEKHLSTVAKKMRSELAATGSEALRIAHENLDEVEVRITEQKANLSTQSHRIDAVDEQIRRDENELDNIKGIGDLETLQARIHTLEEDLRHLESEENRIRKQMKEHFRSEDISKYFFEDKLQVGLNKLRDLADRNVIPGTSVEVLRDRLQLGICICGEVLEEGHSRHIHVMQLIDEQSETTPRLQRLTALWHEARNRINLTPDAEEASDTGKIALLREEFTQCRDRKRNKVTELTNQREKRGQIDEERIQVLSQRLQSSRGKLSRFNQEYGQINGLILQLEEQRKLFEERVAEEERKADLSKILRRRSSVANDLETLTQGTLGNLKSIYVQRVSTLMNDLFLGIVGADPSLDANVFTGVNINAKYDIIIHTLSLIHI